MSVPLITLLALLVISTFVHGKVTKIGGNDVQDSSLNVDHCKSKWLRGEKENGEFDIEVPGLQHPVKVHCNFTSGQAFTVIQRRQYGTESFNRNWNEYKKGFGHPQADYWAGLDAINYFTATGYSTLRIDLADWSYPNPQAAYAQYKNFYVQNEANYYKMTVSSEGYIGNIKDDFSYHSGNYFFTYDRPDQYNCAQNMFAGWWFYYCSYANLNGHYYPNGRYKPNYKGFYDGIYWKDWADFDYSMKFASMTLYKM